MGRPKGSSNVVVKIGHVFGRLTILEIGPTLNRKRKVLCSCQCGTEKWINAGDIYHGVTRSCGCLASDNGRKNVKLAQQACITHGQTRKATGGYTKAYKTWIYMRRRCSDPAIIGYENYGGRGIKVCSRWQDSFENFFADMGNPPHSDSSIDRIDSNGDYVPLNCRWSNRVEQARNRRNRISATLDGVEMCLKEAAQKLGVNYRSLWSRIKYGWTIEEAVNTPFRAVKRGAES